MSTSGSEVGCGHGSDAGLAEVTQPVRAGAFDELVEVEGFVYFFEVLVVEVVVRLVTHRFQFVFEQCK